MGVFELIYGVLFQPKETFKYLSENKPVGKALLIYFGVLLVGSLLSYREAYNLPHLDMGQFGLPGFEEVLGSLMLLMGFMSIFISFIILFVQAGVFTLIGELLGGEGNSVGLLTVLALAFTPTLIVSLLDALIGITGLPGLISLVISLGGLVWVFILHVIGVKEALQLSVGRSIATILLPIVVFLVALVAVVIAMVVMMVPLMPNFPHF